MNVNNSNKSKIQPQRLAQQEKMTSRKNTILEGLQIILEDLHLDITELVDTEWDAAIISDGSGTTLDKPVGWASILLLKNSNEYFLPNCGSMSFGTNNLA